jgi:soluble lytic murein transglycosylase-like protein
MTKNDITFAVVLWGLLLIFVLYALDCNADDTQKMEQYVSEYFDGLYPKRQARAISYIPLIVESGKKYTLDPWLLLVVMRHESGYAWKRKGAAGEVGLMQVKNRPRPIEPAANINRGAEILRMYLDRCGTVLQALSAYQTGRCKPVIKTAKLRFREYKGTK